MCPIDLKLTGLNYWVNESLIKIETIEKSAYLEYKQLRNI